jgi:uncharacterized UPF0160 family protein
MQTIVTHNGKFHTDDVFAIVTLFLLLGKENCRVIRTRDEAVIKEADYVVDVGQIYEVETKRFDHHQLEGAGKRENGIPYASFGLVWKEYGEQVTGSKSIADRVDTKLVQAIDAVDNGTDISKPLIEGVYSLDVNSLVNLYRPTWTEDQDWDKNFNKCCEWAINILLRIIKVQSDVEKAENSILAIYNNTSDKKIIIIGEEYDFGRELITGVLSPMPEPIYAVMYRSDSENWEVVALRKNKDTFESKKPLPEAWRAKSGEELNQATGYNDTIFCHRGGFMCVVGSKETALKLAETALNA